MTADVYKLNHAFMLMKRLLLMVALCSSTLAGWTEEAPGMIITRVGKDTENIDLSTLQCIKFADGVMLVHKTDDTQMVISLSDITSVTFGTVASAIHTITGGVPSSLISVTDLAGRIIYQGEAGGFRQYDHYRGIVIVRSGNRSYKVRIGGKQQ